MYDEKENVGLFAFFAFFGSFRILKKHWKLKDFFPFRHFEETDAIML